MNVYLEEHLLNWVLECSDSMLHISRKIIKVKVKSMLNDMTQGPAVKESFVVSNGWLENFM